MTRSRLRHRRDARKLTRKYRTVTHVPGSARAIHPTQPSQLSQNATLTRTATKYLYSYVVQGYYAPAYGWEDLGEHDTKQAAQGELLDYLTNEPEFRHRVVTRRTANPDWRKPGHI
jgi:hypothetical protein